MSKSLLKGKAGLEQLRTLEGLISLSESNEKGKVLNHVGEPHEELPTVTSSFMELGQMLGQSLGLAHCDEVLVNMPDRQAFFTILNGRIVGLERFTR